MESEVWGRVSSGRAAVRLAEFKGRASIACAAVGVVREIIVADSSACRHCVARIVRAVENRPPPLPRTVVLAAYAELPRAVILEDLPYPTGTVRLDVERPVSLPELGDVGVHVIMPVRGRGIRRDRGTGIARHEVRYAVACHGGRFSGNS